jgi:hypothetical protein
MSRKHIELLAEYLRIYLKQMRIAVIPTPRRNSAIRVVQPLLGRILLLLDQSSAYNFVNSPFSADEIAVIKIILAELLQMYQEGFEFEQRENVLDELFELQGLIK